MHTIAISDDTFQSMTELAAQRHQTLEQLLTDLVAQERWEEHAAHAYDAYHAREQGPHEVMSEDEFFESLHDQPGAPAGEPDADV